MIKETFRHIDFSNPKRIQKTKEGKIELKEFSDDLQFLISFDNSLKPRFSKGAITPVTDEGNYELGEFSSLGFGKHLKINNGFIVYETDTLKNINKEGSVQFYLKSDFNRGRGQQSFKKSTFNITENGIYSFSIYINDEKLGDYDISLSPTNTPSDLNNNIVSAIGQNTLNYDFTDNIITLISKNIGQVLEIRDIEGKNSLIDLLGGVTESIMPNAPEDDIAFLSFRETGNNNNAIDFHHTTDSHIKINMYDKNGDLIINEDLGMWSNKHTEFSFMEFSFNDDMGFFFIDGKLKKVFMLDIDRIDGNTYLILQGNGNNKSHCFDEIAIFNEVQHKKGYELKTTTFTPYDNNNPYIDIHFGNGFKEEEVKDIIIKGSDNLNFSVKIGSNWYYYFNNSWRISNGSFSQSTELDIFEIEFASLFFNSDFDLIIRIFFHSDGWTPSFIDEISIIKEQGSESAAYIEGTVKLLNPVNLSDDASVIITTNKGSKEIDLTTEASDPFNVTLEEIQEAIRKAEVPGLEVVTDDGNGRLVLIASSKGADSYIAISETDSDSALEIIWGEETSSMGNDEVTPSNEYLNFEELFRWIRSRLGAPLVPVELTDEQLEDCLSESIWYFNRWRNFEESLEYVTLRGNPRDGYELPPIIGTHEDITEIILRPKFPTGGGWLHSRSGLMDNIFVQHIFNNNQMMANAADWHIAMVANKDFNMIMGTEVKWEIINKRIFIYPNPVDQFQIGIKFRTKLSIDEIVNNMQIKQLCLSLAKISLGTIRSTFGNQIPGGDGMLQLNGSELKQEGMAERDALIQEWQKNPMGYEWMIG